MNLPLLCKSIQTRVARELDAAKTQENKAFTLTSALYEYGHSVLAGLQTLSEEVGAESSLYQQAQAAASELLTFLTLPFISSCSTYKQGVTVLEDLCAMCTDDTLRRRLVIYSNQVKKRWNKADPAALPINPRGAKLQSKREGAWRNIVVVAVLIATALFLFTHLEQILMLFPQWNVSRQNTLPPLVEGEREKVAPAESEDGVARPSEVAEPQVTAAAGEYYSYTDKNGVTHLGNTPAPRSGLTPVVIKGNQVLVPVLLSYRGRSVKTMLVLDTGASVTTISERTAALLGVDPTATRLGTSTVADGRTVASRLFVADSVAVGSTSSLQQQVSILPGSGGEGNDGLLGMDFLKNIRYHVDFSRSVIELNAQ